MSGWYERSVRIRSYVIALLVSAGLLWLVRSQGWQDGLLDLLRPNRATLYGTVAQIAGSLLGFIITALSLMIAFIDEQRFRLLHQAGRYMQTMRLFFDAIAVLALLTVVALLGLLVDGDPATSRADVPAVFFLLIALSAAGTYRCVWALYQIVNLITRHRMHRVS